MSGRNLVAVPAGTVLQRRSCPGHERRGFLRLMEPACGAGGMIIAAANALHDAKINYQQAMHVVAIDIDRRCVHMAYLQLALLHIPAIVVHGNALTGEEWEHWYTPAHVVGDWGARLRQREAIQAMGEMLVALAAVDAPIPTVEPAPAAAATLAPPQTVLSQAARQVAAAGQMTLF